MYFIALALDHSSSKGFLCSYKNSNLRQKKGLKMINKMIKIAAENLCNRVGKSW